ncbi:MAG TPA: hypothetical protein VMW69_04535 [Spirochaetia bacterium]|nr:hypothetical protein [Spirochaetia bacterium]
MSFRGFALSLILLGFPLFSSSAASAEPSKQLLADGIGFFREAGASESTIRAHALYNDALERFETLVKQRGIRNAEIFYDIGNTYYRMGDIGRAILSYRRAELYRAGDQNIEQNLAYVRSKRKDDFPVNEGSTLLHVLFFWHYDVGVRWQSVAFAVCFGSVWLLILSRRITGMGWLRWPTGTAALLASLLLVSLTWRQIDLSTRRDGVIVSESVTARKGDALSYDPTFKGPLHSGTEFRVLSTRPEWYHIELTDGSTAWIPTDSALLVRPVSAG